MGNAESINEINSLREEIAVLTMKYNLGELQDDEINYLTSLSAHLQIVEAAARAEMEGGAGWQSIFCFLPPVDSQIEDQPQYDPTGYDPNNLFDGNQYVDPNATGQYPPQNQGYPTNDGSFVNAAYPNYNNVNYPPNYPGGPNLQPTYQYEPLGQSELDSFPNKSTVRFPSGDSLSPSIQINQNPPTQFPETAAPQFQKNEVVVPRLPLEKSLSRFSITLDTNKSDGSEVMLNATISKSVDTPVEKTTTSPSSEEQNVEGVIAKTSVDNSMDVERLSFAPHAEVMNNEIPGKNCEVAEVVVANIQSGGLGLVLGVFTPVSCQGRPVQRLIVKQLRKIKGKDGPCKDKIFPGDVIFMVNCKCYTSTDAMATSLLTKKSHLVITVLRPLK